MNTNTLFMNKPIAPAPNNANFCTPPLQKFLHDSNIRLATAIADKKELENYIKAHKTKYKSAVESEAKLYKQNYELKRALLGLELQNQSNNSNEKNSNIPDIDLYTKINDTDIEALELQLKEAKEKYAMLEVKVVTLTENLTKNLSAVKNFAEESKFKCQQIQELKNSVANLTEDKKQLYEIYVTQKNQEDTPPTKRERKNFVDKINQLRSELTSKNEEIIELEVALKQEKNRTKGNFKENNKMLLSRSDDMATIKNLQKENQGLLNIINNQNLAINDVSERILTLGPEQNHFDSNIKNLMQSLKEFEDKKRSLFERQDTDQSIGNESEDFVSNIILKYNEQILSLEEKAQALENDKLKLSDVIKVNENTIENLSKDIIKQNSDNEPSKVEVSSLQKYQTETLGLNESIFKDCKDFKQFKEEEFETLLETYNDLKEKTDIKDSNLRKDIDALNSLNEILNMTNIELREKVDELNSQLNSLRNELDQVKISKEEAVNDISEQTGSSASSKKSTFEKKNNQRYRENINKSLNKIKGLTKNSEIERLEFYKLQNEIKILTDTSDMERMEFLNDISQIKTKNENLKNEYNRIHDLFMNLQNEYNNVSSHCKSYEQKLDFCFKEKQSLLDAIGAHEQEKSELAEKFDNLKNQIVWDKEDSTFYEANVSVLEKQVAKLTNTLLNHSDDKTCLSPNSYPSFFDNSCIRNDTTSVAKTRSKFIEQLAKLENLDTEFSILKDKANVEQPNPTHNNEIDNNIYHKSDDSDSVRIEYDNINEEDELDSSQIDFEKKSNSRKYIINKTFQAQFRNDKHYAPNCESEDSAEEEERLDEPELVEVDLNDGFVSDNIDDEINDRIESISNGIERISHGLGNRQRKLHCPLSSSMNFIEFRKNKSAHKKSMSQGFIGFRSLDSDSNAIGESISDLFKTKMQRCGSGLYKNSGNYNKADSSVNKENIRNENQNLGNVMKPSDD